MSFEAPKFTNAGKALQARALAGATLTFTKMQIGDGTMASGATIAAMTALISVKASITISSIKRTSTAAIVKGAYTNSAVTTGFYWREIGLFAADPDHASDRSYDILYCYQNAGAMAEYIPSASSAAVEKVLSIAAVVGDATSVTAALTADSFALATDLTAHTGDNTVHITATDRTAWNGKQAALTFDASPTSGSSNPVKSGGVYTALDGKAPTSHASSATTYGAGTSSAYGHVKLSDATTSTSAATAGIAATPKAVKTVKDTLDTHTQSTAVHITEAERTAWNGKQAALTFDSAPKSGSANPVTSGGVYTAIMSAIGDIDTVLNTINGEVI